jgi:acyl-CoA thioesterase-1
MTLATARRALLIAAAAFCMSVFVMTGPARARAADGTRIVTMLGDSITAGYGLPAGAALPAQLQARLQALGLKVQVRAAGVSGDTTADGLARVDFSVKGDTDLAIVALGGNDLLQGVDPKAIRANLDAIVGRLKARRIPVLLMGMMAPHAMGAGYARDYDAVFPAVAKGAKVGLYPNLLDGVMLDKALNQPDGVHPNPKGVTIIAARLAPVVAAALKSGR